MNSSSISTNAISRSDVHGSLPAIAATLGMAAVLEPIAYAQFGPSGMVTIGAFTAANIVSVWIAAWGAAKLSRNHHLLAALFASSGIRMAAPLIIALVVVLGRGRIAPIESVYYVVPLYLCMLAADVAVWVREARKAGPTAARGAAQGFTATGEAG